MSTLATAATSSAVTATQRIILVVHLIQTGVTADIIPMPWNVFGRQRICVCYLYCLPQTVETDTELS